MKLSRASGTLVRPSRIVERRVLQDLRAARARALPRVIGI